MVDKVTRTHCLHASKALPKWAREVAEEDPYYVTALGKYPITMVALGAIIGTVEIIELQTTDAVRDLVGRKEYAFGDYGPRRWAWLLANPERLAEPIPCRGSLGLWEVPEDICKSLKTNS